MKPKIKRILSGVGAITVAAALAVGGTFAYFSREHKANTVQGLARYQARLVEEYEKEPEWIKDTPIKKEVSVRNMGGVAPQFPGDNWGDIYVALQLLEYMDITPVEYRYYPEGDAESTRFMVDIQGNFVRFPSAGTETTISNALLNDIKGTGANASDWDSLWTDVIGDAAKREAYRKTLVASDFVRISGLYDVDADGNDVYYWYLKTKKGDPNGQYGAYVVTSVVPDVSARKVITGTEHSPRLADTVDGQDTATYEDYSRYYAPHNWTACDNTSDSYMSADAFGAQKADSAAPGNWMWLSDWDGTTGVFWLIDDTPGREGWCYWAEPLAPTKSTTKLIESITPKIVPEELMFYDLYVHMEAYSKFDPNMPSWFPLYEAPDFRAVPQGPTNIPVNGTLLFNSYLGAGTSNNVTAETTWTLHGSMPLGTGTPNTANGCTLTEANGVVTLTAGPTATTVWVKAAYGDYEPVVIEVTVEALAGPGTINTDGLPATAKVGEQYTGQLTASGPNVTWDIAEGSALPDGLELSAGGALTGTPTTDGPYTFTVEATNEGGTVTKEITIVVSPPDGPGTVIDLKKPGGQPNSPTNPFVPMENVPSGPDTMENRQKADFDSDYMVVDVYYDHTPPLFVFPGPDGASHFGYFKLSDIIDGGNLADVEIDEIELATLNDGKLNTSNLKRIQDPRTSRNGEEVIEYSLIADTWDAGQEGGSFWSGNYYVDVRIPLVRMVSGV
ncbi:MAG: hypothetical protein LBB50_05015, partial [Oscillospiraceae bacterium]|nr:hypothetical protein [Oscillospiraceae bacterium]